MNGIISCVLSKQLGRCLRIAEINNPFASYGFEGIILSNLVIELLNLLSYLGVILEYNFTTHW